MMKKALAVVVACGLVGVASAAIELYLKEGGVNNYIFDYSPRNYLPYFDHAGSAVIPPGQVIPGGPIDRTFFLWGRFTGEDDLATKVFGVAPSVSVDGNLVMQENVIYRHKKINGIPAQRWMRWDGTTNIGINGPAAAVTANGIVNDPTNSWDLVAPDAGDNAAFLLGAFRVTSTDVALGRIMLGVGRLGIAANDGTQSYYPAVYVNGVLVQERWYEAGQPLPTVPVTHAAPVYLEYVPEPASVLLLGLASLLIRRR